MGTTIRMIACVALGLAVVGVTVGNIPMLPLGLFLWCLSTVVKG